MIINLFLLPCQNTAPFKYNFYSYFPLQMPRNSAMPEQVFSSHQSPSALGGKEKEILELILESWPTCALEIAQHFNEDLSSRDSKKLASTKYSYYLKKLVEKQLVLSKRVGNALIVWPLQAEKLRTIHKILEFEHPHR